MKPHPVCLFGWFASVWDNNICNSLKNLSLNCRSYMYASLLHYHLMFSVCAISTKVLAGSIFLLVSKNYPNVSAEIIQLTVPITTILTHQGPFTLGATWYDAVKMSRISIVAFRLQATFSVSVGLFCHCPVSHVTLQKTMAGHENNILAIKIAITFSTPI